MATKYPNTKYTLLDRAKRTADGKRVLDIIRVMDEKVDDFFQDVPFVEANMGLQHRITRDTGMVASENRSFYQGVGSSKRNVQTVMEAIQLKERRREIDEDEVDTLGDEGRAKILRQEDESHIRKLGEDVVDGFFNSVSSSGSEFIDGIFARLASLNPSGLDNVRSNGHSGTGTSVVMMEWNTDKTGGAFGIFPPGWMKNTAFGVMMRDKGKEHVLDEDDSTKKFYAYVAQFKAWLGLAVGNNRKIARLANINPSRSGSNAFGDDAVEKMIELLHNGRFDRNRTRIYVNTTIAAHMDIYALNKTNVLWPTMEIFGKQVKGFQGIPIRELDTTIISNSQAVVTA